jgi:hypothetical protein
MLRLVPEINTRLLVRNERRMPPWGLQRKALQISSLLTTSFRFNTSSYECLSVYRDHWFSADISPQLAGMRN